MIRPLIYSQEESLHKIGNALDPGKAIPSIISDIFSSFEQESSKRFNQENKRNKLKTVASYIRGVAQEKPVIIHFDNVHAIDSASGDLLQCLYENLKPGERTPMPRPVVFIMSMKNSEEKQFLSHFPEKHQFIEVKFSSSLECKELKAILEYSLKLEKTSAEMIAAKFISPMEAKLPAMFHYVSGLSEQGILVEGDDNCFKLHLEDMEKDHLPHPQTCEAVLKEKLSSFTPYQLKVITYAACIGEHFEIMALRDCLDFS